MGRELLGSSPAVRRTIEQCDELLRHHVSWSLIDELNATEDAVRDFDETEFAQPALFALQVALAGLWRSWGVSPDAVVGHSVGEVAAAHIAGCLTLEDAVRVIAHRGRLMQAATGNGSMASVELPLETLERAIAPYGARLSIAAVNAPSVTVISGEASAMTELVTSLRADGANVRSLPVNYAFHSRQMQPHAHDLELALVGLAPVEGTTRFVSTVSGEPVAGTRLDAAYWQPTSASRCGSRPRSNRSRRSDATCSSRSGRSPCSVEPWHRRLTRSATRESSPPRCAGVARTSRHAGFARRAGLPWGRSRLGWGDAGAAPGPSSADLPVAASAPLGCDVAAGRRDSGQPTPRRVRECTRHPSIHCWAAVCVPRRSTAWSWESELSSHDPSFVDDHRHR